MHGYILTSTKRSFSGTLCSYNAIYLSVIQNITSCSYSTYVIWKLTGFMLYVVSCHIVLYLYNIYTESNLRFFTTYSMCMLCKSRVMYQSICVFVHDHHMLYCIILHEYHMEQFFMFQQLTIMWYCVQYFYHM